VIGGASGVCGWVRWRGEGSGCAPCGCLVDASVQVVKGGAVGKESVAWLSGQGVLRLVERGEVGKLTLAFVDHWSVESWWS
jgi:hypothetical protein